MTDKTHYDLIILGAGPAGMTAAVYAARKQLEILVISEDIGGQATWSSDIENYLGYIYITGVELVQKFEEHVKAFKGGHALPTLGALLLGGGALTAGGIGAAMAGSAGVHGIDRLVQAVKKGHQYKKMMEANPELSHYDSSEVQQAFNTLHKFNPELAGDPLVAGTFVRRVADADAIDHRTVGDLVKTRKDMGRPFGQQAASGQSFNAALGMLGK